MTSQSTVSITTDIGDQRERARQVAQACADLLREQFGARRVILFGSLVGPEPWHEGSDIDLAVEGIPSEQFFKAWGACDRLLPRDLGMVLDLVPLEDVSPRMRARILGEVDVPADPLRALRQLVEAELATLEEVIQSAEYTLTRFSDPTNPEQYEMRGLASYVHDFYNGVESIFERIAVHFDRQLPRGEHSHADLLEQMAAPREGVRDTVVDEALRVQLKELLDFRHFFRHAYGYKLEWDRLRLNVEAMKPVLEQLRKQLAQFFDKQAC